MTIIESIKHKRGDVREDGMVFWGMIRKKPCWLTPEKFNQYRQKEKETLKRNYLKKHEERIAKNREYYQLNKERHREVGKIWLNANPEKRKEIYKRYYQNNKDKVKTANENWRNKNPDKVKIIGKRLQAERRDRFKSQSKLSKDQKKIVECFYEQAQRLQKKLGIKMHVDHIIPLAKGGRHMPSNLQVLPASINIRKHAKDIFRWSELQLN